ncbi:ATP-binding protein [Kitasatospora phosalacinea]|uniref:ATP-binding protein n=1 Tax=Kitasatospora phosalacinea TaxID=2065 RepID=UPI0025525BE4|nr:ATP-binding protein [Kitasatospora phosalacinea]
MGQPSGDFRGDGVRPRSGELVSGERLVVVGGPEGSEARHCPDEWMPQPRRIRGLVQARPELGPSPAVGPLALGAGPGDLRLLDREGDIAALLEQLRAGRSVQLVGQAGSGRSALLAAVAEAAGELAPDGVVRLSGYRRTVTDLLQDLFAATHQAPDFRPDREQLAELLAGVAAVVVIDDVEPYGEELEELLALAPECAFLIAAVPGSPPPAPGSRLRDHLVAGLSRPASLTLAARLAGRPLDEVERAWAVDLWFESEGLPLRFVRAAALLRQRDVTVDALVAAQEDRRSLFGSVQEYELPRDPAELERELRQQVPLPSVGESAAPARRLVQGLSESARLVLRLALALGGECPTAPHLPALLDVGLGESALQELVEAGLAVSVGGHHRLTEGVLDALLPEVEDDSNGLPAPFAPGGIAYGAAEHLAWWVGHASVSTRQVAAEAEVILAVLLAERNADRPAEVLRLARAAAPALALSLRWGAWERVLQLGLEAARMLGANAEQGWFHHELGVHALCTGDSRRAVAELEAALALRAAAGEQRGVAGARRMLDLIRIEETAALTAGTDTAPARRRRSIRAIAQVVPGRLRKRAPRGARKTVLLAGAAVMALGALGTAIGVAATGDDHPGGDRTGNSADDRPPLDPSPAPRSSSPTPAPSSGSPTATDSPTASGSPSPSASTTSSPSATHKPSGSPSPSATTTKPGTGTTGGSTGGTTGGSTGTGGTTSGGTTGGSTGGTTGGSTGTGGTTTGGSTGGTTGGSTGTGGTTTGGTTGGSTGGTTGGSTGTGGTTTGGTTGGSTGGTTTGGATGGATGGTTTGGATGGTP